jgi:hypothetical protein
MKKVLLTTFIMMGFTGGALAQNDPFAPLPDQDMQGYSANMGTSPRGFDPEMEMLKDEMRMQLEEMRSLKNDLQDIRSKNTSEAKAEEVVEKRKEESVFVGVVDGAKLYRNKETGDFFSLTGQALSENKITNEIDKEEGQK